jgi:hypothetical protein
MPLIAVFTQASTLSLGRVVRALPHDAAAIVGYVLIGAFVWFVWQGSRKRPDNHSDTEA